MENLLKQLLALDRRARNLVEQTERQREEATARLSENKAKVQLEYAQRAQNHLEKVKSEYEKSVGRKVITEEEHYQSALENLKNRFDDNHEFWVKTIVDRCTGKA